MDEHTVKSPKYPSPEPSESPRLPQACYLRPLSSIGKWNPQLQRKSQPREPAPKAEKQPQSSLPSPDLVSPRGEDFGTPTSGTKDHFIKPPIRQSTAPLPLHPRRPPSKRPTSMDERLVEEIRERGRLSEENRRKDRSLLDLQNLFASKQAMNERLERENQHLKNMLSLVEENMKASRESGSGSDCRGWRAT